MQTSRILQAWRGMALMAVAAVAVVNVIATAGKVPPPLSTDAPLAMRDYVTRSEPRFAAFREFANARGLRGKMGYIESLRDTGSPQDAFQPDYFIAQYALLPLLLDVKMEPHDWALANFVAPPPPLPAGWEIARDFGEGVMLLKKAQ